MLNYCLFKKSKNIHVIIYKVIVFSIMTIIYTLNQPAFSDLMDESRRANQKSNDIMSLLAEDKMCQNSCSSSFNSDALNNPSNANWIFNRCRSGCQENYQSKMSCIVSQPATQYSPSKCNGSFRGDSWSDNSSSINSSSTSSKILLIILIVIATLFYVKKNKPDFFANSFKNKINENLNYNDTKLIIQSDFAKTNKLYFLIFWGILFGLLLMGIFKSKSSELMPFFTVSSLIIGGLIITIVIQSYFNREHPPLKIPEFITDQITVFIIGAISVLFTFLLFFWWAQINPNTVVNDPQDNLLFFGICIFLSYSFQINYHNRLIKSIPILNLYITTVPFSVVCFYTFNDDGNIVSIVYFIVTISVVFFSQNKNLSEFYRQFNSILGFDSFVKFILRIIKHPNQFSINKTDSSYPFTESKNNFPTGNSIISANESKEFISKIKNIWQGKGKTIFLYFINKIKSKLHIIIGIIVLIVIINLLYQLINYSNKDVAEPQLKNKNSSSSTIKVPIQIDPPSTSIEVPQRVRTSASVIAGTCERPEYPSASKKLDEEGTVYLKFLVDAEGKVIQSEIERSSGYIRLDEAALNGLSRCKFKPATEDGRPEQAWTSMKFTWRLE